MRQDAPRPLGEPITCLRTGRQSRQRIAVDRDWFDQGVGEAIGVNAPAARRQRTHHLLDRDHREQSAPERLPLQPEPARPYTIALTRNVAEEQRRPIGPAREKRRKRPDTPAAGARSGPGVRGAPDRSRRCDVVCRTQKELAEVERKTPPVSLGVPLGRPQRSGGQAPEADALSAELQARGCR